MRPRSRHELSAPTVDLITGKCIPGKMIRTVSASPLTVDMTVSCKPEPEYMQQGVNAGGLPLTKSVGISWQMSTRVRPLLRRQVWGEVMRDLRRRNLHRTTCRSPRSCCRRLGGRPPHPCRPRLRCRGALQKTRRRRFRPIVCRRVNRRSVRVRIVCLMCHQYRRSVPIGKKKCPNPMGGYCRRY